MDQEAIRVWFCTPDIPFVQLMARTFGGKFELQTIEAFHLNGARRRIDWPDVVLLDLRAEGDSPAVESRPSSSCKRSSSLIRRLP